MTAEEMTEILTDILHNTEIGGAEGNIDILQVTCDFEDEGLLTHDPGFVLCVGGQEFQITVQKGSH